MKTESRDLVIAGAKLAYELAVTASRPNEVIDVLHELEAKADADDLAGAQASLAQLRAFASPSPATSEKLTRKKKAAKTAAKESKPS